VQPGPGFVQLPIDYSDADNVSPQFSNLFAIQNTGTEFNLLFYNASPPILIGPGADQQLRNLKSIKPKCLSRVVVTADQMMAICKDIQENIRKVM